MATDLDSIKQTLVNISKGESLLDTLLEFERTLDNAEIFAYKNWILGELVEGPNIERYWYKTVWMYPYALMPDPNAGLRLTKLGAKVSFSKGTFSKPVKVRGPGDWADPESKRAKMAEHEVWLVTIELPIKYINRGLERIDDIIQKDIDATNAEIADAYSNDMPPADDTGMGDMPPDEDMGDIPPEDDISGGNV
jgi:hypothetical protein